MTEEHRTSNSLVVKLRVAASLLKEWGVAFPPAGDGPGLYTSAADEIERLQRCLFQMQEAAKQLAAEPPTAPKVITRPFILCNAYESGYGHGFAGDDLVNPYTPGGEEHEAYQIGVDAGYAASKRGAAVPPSGDSK